MTEQMQIKYAPALPKIEVPQFNFEELKTQITANLEKYKNLVVTEDAIQEAKKTRQNLNKFKIMVDDERKRIHKVYEAPYEAVKPKFDELCKLIDEPIKAIDKQVQVFEDKELSKKQDEIGKLYKANIGPLETIVPIGKIYNSQWENKTYTLKKVEKEILEAIEKINSDLRVITGFKSEFETELRTTYLDTFNLETVLNKKLKLEEQAKFIEEQNKIKEQQTIEAEQNKLEEASEVLAETMTQEKEIIETALHVVEKIHHQEFWVNATKSQLIALNDFLIKNSIEFGVIAKQELARA